MVKRKKTGGRDFQKGADPRRKLSPRKGTGMPQWVKDRCIAMTPDALNTYETALKADNASWRERIVAADRILDRAIGKVPQPIEAEGGLLVTFPVAFNDANRKAGKRNPDTQDE